MRERLISIEIVINKQTFVMVMSSVVVVLIGRIFGVELCLLLIERIGWVKAPVFVFHLLVLAIKCHSFYSVVVAVKIRIRLGARKILALRKKKKKIHVRECSRSFLNNYQHDALWRYVVGSISQNCLAATTATE